jgi:hypothetical protein
MPEAKVFRSKYSVFWSFNWTHPGAFALVSAAWSTFSLDLHITNALLSLVKWSLSLIIPMRTKCTPQPTVTFYPRPSTWDCSTPLRTCHYMKLLGFPPLSYVFLPREGPDQRTAVRIHCFLEPSSSQYIENSPSMPSPPKRSPSRRKLFSPVRPSLDQGGQAAHSG